LILIRKKLVYNVEINKVNKYDKIIKN